MDEKKFFFAPMSLRQVSGNFLAKNLFQFQNKILYHPENNTTIYNLKYDEYRKSKEAVIPSPRFAEYKLVFNLPNQGVTITTSPMTCTLDASSEQS